MPTKKEIFLALKNLLDANITEVSGRIYSAYPKKTITLPFIVISNPEYNENVYSINDSVISYSYTVDIYVYTKTSQELDELTQKVIDTLRNNDILGATKSIREEESVEYNLTNKIMHEGMITVELQW